jgi:hypothetical protein
MREPLGIIHIFVTGEPSEDRLPQHTDQVVPAIPPMSAFLQWLGRGGSPTKGIVELARDEHFGVRGDRRAINSNFRRRSKSTRRGLLFDSPAGSAISASPKAQ